MKVTVVLDNSRVTSNVFERVVAVFSDYDTAVEYCNHEDPKELRLVCEEYEVDGKLDDSEKPDLQYKP